MSLWKIAHQKEWWKNNIYIKEDQNNCKVALRATSIRNNPVFMSSNLAKRYVFHKFRTYFWRYASNGVRISPLCSYLPHNWQHQITAASLQDSEHAEKCWHRIHTPYFFWWTFNGSSFEASVKWQILLAHTMI